MSMTMCQVACMLCWECIKAGNDPKDCPDCRECDACLEVLRSGEPTGWL